MDTFIRKTFSQIMNIIDFWGDLTDISAKTEALQQTPPLSRIQPIHRLYHPEYHLCSLYKNMITGSMYPEAFQFGFEKIFTERRYRS